MSGVSTSTALGLVTRLATPLFGWLRRQLLRRGAERGLPTWVADSTPEINEALDVLAGGDGVIGRVLAQGKAWASDRPEAFDLPTFQSWVRDGRVRRELEMATLRFVSEQDFDTQKHEALRLFEEITGETRRVADRPFHDALAFVALSIRTYLPAHARIIVENANANRREIVAAVNALPQLIGADRDAVHERLDRALSGQVGSSAAPGSVALAVPVAECSADDLATLSTDLLEWPRDIEGWRIDRPELSTVEAALDREAESGQAHKAVILVGPPGSGKSALLAALGERLREQGQVVLGIKADLLPPEIATLGDLGAAIGLSGDLPSEIAAQAAEHGRIYLLIDQLDSVAALIDGSGSRLRVLAQLVRRVRSVSGVRIVAAVRQFEFKADANIRRALPENSTVRVQLDLPARAVIDPILEAFSIAPSEIPPALDEIIRTPQALKDIVAARRAGCPWGALTSWRTAQAERLDGLVSRYPALEFGAIFNALIRARRETGTLWIPDSRLPLGSFEAVDLLCAQGILHRREDARTVGFAHQTWAETIDARHALAEGDLADRIRAMQDNLLARPHILAVLRFVRDVATEHYSAVIGRIWDDPALRRHIRILALDIGASAGTPTSAERRILREVMRGEDEALAQRVLRMSAGIPAWWSILRGFVEDRMAATEVGRALSVLHYLVQATVFADEDILTLIERHWIGRVDVECRALFVFEKMPRWSERAFALFNSILERTESVTPLFPHVIRRQAEADRHDVAARLLGAIWDKLAVHSRGRTPRSGHDFARVLRAMHGLHGFARIATRAPEIYLRVLIPRLAGTNPSVGDSTRGRRRSPLGTVDHDTIDGTESNQSAARPQKVFDLDLVEAARVALEVLARTDSEAFLSMVPPPQDGVADELVQRLFALAFAANASTLAAEGLEFIRLDSSRLGLGSSWDEQCDSIHLAASLSRSLGPTENEILVVLIRSWHAFDFRLVGAANDVKERRRRRRENRRRQLRLLRALDTERLSTQTRRYIDEELRALPEFDIGRRRVSGYVRSPMSAGQMERASNDDIIRLFGNLPDNTGWDHPRKQLDLIGGSVPASSELAELTKRDPERTLTLLSHLSAEGNQRPVGAVLRTLAEMDNVDAGVVLDAVDAAVAQGFGRDEFRDDCASIVEKVAWRAKGLPDRWIAKLTSWLAPWAEPQADTADIDTQPYRPEEADKESRPTSVLFDGGGFRVLPGGNYPVLTAITAGLLARADPDYATWFTILDRRTDESENPEVWAAFSLHLKYLRNVRNGRETALVSDLFERYPIVRDSPEGAHLVAHLVAVLDSDFVDATLAAWARSGWSLAPVALGEISALRAALLNPSATVDSWPCQDPGDAVDLETLVGVANVAIEFWNDADRLRGEWADRVLTAIIPRAEGRLAEVIGDIFRRTGELPRDNRTHRLLGALAANPSVLCRIGDISTDDRLAELVDDPSFHDPVLTLIEQLVRENSRRLADHSTAGPFLAQGLIPIVLTIHREPKMRCRALDVFELLMDLVPGMADEVLQLSLAEPDRTT